MVSWNAMVTGFMHTGYVNRALKLFNEMPHRCGFMEYNDFHVCAKRALRGGYSSFLSNTIGRCETKLKNIHHYAPRLVLACSNLIVLELGMDIYEKIIKSGYQFDVLLVNALIDMFAKCGSIIMAHNT